MQCPTCHRDNELHSGPGGSAPQPGNVSLCWGCGAIGIFTAVGIRKATPEELVEIMELPDVKAARAAMAFGGDPVDAVNAMTRRARGKYS